MFNFIKPHASRVQESPVHPVNVLIVDDEEPVRRFVDRVLTGAGYQTTLASDGPEAIEIAAKVGTVLGILVTDVMMPQMGGDELCTPSAADGAERSKCCI